MGIIAAQSITSSLTQTVLNQFHSCGANIKTIVKGVPRLFELLNLTQELHPTIMTIGLRDASSHYRRSIEYTTFKSLLSSYTLVPAPVWVNWYQPSHPPTTTGLLIVMNAQRIRTLHVAFELFEILCQYDDVSFVMNPQFEIFMWGCSPDDLEHDVLPRLNQTQVCGLINVQRVIETIDGLLLYTTPHRSLFQRLLTMPAVDPYVSVSNNIWDICRTLGIEAARMYLYRELREIMDPNILTVHLELLINQMSWGGTLQSISRYSVRCDSSAVFTKASFEESMLNFLNAIFHEEDDHLDEVSSTIVTGQRSKVGTGFFGVLFAS